MKEYVYNDNSDVIKVVYNTGDLCIDKIIYLDTENNPIVYISNLSHAVNCYIWNLADIKFSDANQLWNCN